MISRELERYLPFLKTTAILGVAMKAGLGREDAHEVIKDYAVEEALKMRKGIEQQLILRLAGDDTFARYGITEGQLDDALKNQENIVECAGRQISEVVHNVEEFIEENDYEKKAAYEPEPIL